MKRSAFLLVAFGMGAHGLFMGCSDDSGSGSDGTGGGGAADASATGGTGGVGGGSGGSGATGGSGGSGGSGATGGTGGAGGAGGSAGTGAAGGSAGGAGVSGAAGASAGGSAGSSGAAGMGGASGASGAGGGTAGAAGTAGASGSSGAGGQDAGSDGSTMPIVLNHTSRGAFNSSAVVTLLSQPWKVVGSSYQVRHLGDGMASLPATRSYFTFDLSSVSGTITAAELRIAHPSNSYDSGDASEMVELFDVSTAGSTLASPDDTQPLTVLDAIFDDLGGGVSFGAFTATAADNDTTEIIVLNGAALTSLNTVAGTSTPWSIGASLTSASATTFGATERIFRGSDDTGGGGPPSTELEVTVTP